MLSWITSNPGDAIALVTAVLGVFGIGKKALDLKALKAHVLDELHAKAAQLISDPDAPAKAHAFLEAAAFKLLAELDIKRSAIIDRLVREVISAVERELAEKLFAVYMTKIQSAMADTAATIDKMPAGFVPLADQAALITP